MDYSLVKALPALALWVLGKWESVVLFVAQEWYAHMLPKMAFRTWDVVHGTLSGGYSYVGRSDVNVESKKKKTRDGCGIRSSIKRFVIRQKVPKTREILEPKNGS